MSPRVSYMRRVWGCISASSAATEIMNTPRSVSMAVSTRWVTRRRRPVSSCLAMALAPHLARRSGRGVQHPIARVVVVHRLRELPESLLLLGAQVLGHLDLEAVEDVAAALPAGLRRSFATQALDRSVLRPGREPDSLRAVQGWNLDRGALDRLGDRDRDRDLEIAVRPLHEDRRRRHTRDHVQVTGRPAAGTVLALAGDADPAPVADARRHLHPVALLLERETRSAAGLAGVLDDLAGAPALRAGPADREEPLALGIDAGAAAARTRDRRSPRLGTRAVTCRTGRLL